MPFARVTHLRHANRGKIMLRRDLNSDHLFRSSFLVATSQLGCTVHAVVCNTQHLQVADRAKTQGPGLVCEGQIPSSVSMWRCLSSLFSCEDTEMVSTLPRNSRHGSETDKGSEITIEPKFLSFLLHFNITYHLGSILFVPASPIRPKVTAYLA
jgi:hypothetical protein